MEAYIDALPFWAWLLAAALLGAATLSIYWRCQLAENTALAEAALAERERQLWQAREALSASERRGAAEAEAAWAAATADPEDGAPEAVSRRRYQAWLAQTGGRDAEGRSGEEDRPGENQPDEDRFGDAEAAAPPLALGDPDAFALLDERAQTLAQGVSDVLAALRAGRRPDPERVAVALAEAGAELPEGDADALAWAEMQAESDVEAEEPVAAESIDSVAAGVMGDMAGAGDLAAAAETLRGRVATLERALAESRRAPEADPAAPPPLLLAEMDAPERLGDGAERLRASVDELAAARRRSAQAEAALRQLRAESRAAARARGADAEAQTQARADRAAASAADRARLAQDELAATRRRLSLAETGLRLTRAGAAGATTRLGRAETEADRISRAAAERLGAASDELNATRQRLALAETALRHVRAQAAGTGRTAETIAAAEAQARADARAGIEATLARLRAGGDDLAALRLRATQAEAALRQARAEQAVATRRNADALQAAAASAGRRIEALETETIRARACDAALRGRTWAAEWRLGQARRADAAGANEHGAALSSVLNVTRDDARAARTRSAQLETALRRLRADAATDIAAARNDARAAAEAEELRLALAELETLRARQAETQAALQEPRAAKPKDASMDAPAPASAARVLAQGGARGLSSLNRDRRSADPAENARRMLEDVSSRPLSDIERAAQTLIAEGAVIAIFSNRPELLLARPSDGAPDDLALISGVSRTLESLMNGFGLYYYRQLAEFGPQQLAWIDDRLALRGAVVLERWSPQAQRLAALKRAGRLVVGAEGRWTTPPEGLRPAPQAGAEADPRDESIETVPPHPHSVSVTSPMSGAEAAAQELIERRDFDASQEARPAVFQAGAEGGEIADDFRLIRGVGPGLDALLKSTGLTRYAQLAELSPQEIAWLDQALDLGGRVVRDRWVPQARRLAERGREPAEAAPAARTPDEGAEADDDALTPRLVEIAGTPAPEALEPAPPAPAEAAALELSLLDMDDPTLSTVENAALRLIEAGQPAALAAERPAVALSEPSDGAPDDLKLIQSISPDAETRLNGLGFFYFRQLARLSAEDLAWLDGSMALGGRVARERWVTQAAALAERKANGELHIGAEGSWTSAHARTPAEEAAEAAKASPRSQSELEALRLINAGYVAEERRRPAVLTRRAGMEPPDDLQQIQGVSAKLAAELTRLGLTRLSQMAELGGEEIAWIDAHLRTNGRVVRERWTAQAAELLRRQARKK